MIVTIAQSYVQGSALAPNTVSPSDDTTIGTAATQSAAVVVWLLVANP